MRKISGHRDVTYTACPGDDGYALLGDWRSRVHATRLQRSDPGPTRRAVRLGVHLDVLTQLTPDDAQPSAVALPA